MDDDDQAIEFRRAAGEGALRAMDVIDDEFVEAVTKFYVVTKQTAILMHEKGLDPCDVISRLSGLAADAAYSATCEN